MIADLKRFALLVVAALIVAVSLSSFLAGRYTSTRITALRDTVRIIDSIASVRTDTVIRYQRRVDTVHATSDSLDALVRIVNDSSAYLNEGPQPLITLPPLVIADLRALRLTVATQDTLILSLYQRDTTRLWQIASRDKLIKELSTRHPFACGRKCGLALGFTAGILLHKAAK